MTIKISEKYYTIFKIMMMLGGKATTKNIFKYFSNEDKENFNIKDSVTIGKFLHLKNGLYVKRTLETRGGVGCEQIWELKPRVIEYLEQRQQQNDKE